MCGGSGFIEKCVGEVFFKKKGVGEVFFKKKCVGEVQMKRMSNHNFLGPISGWG